MARMIPPEYDESTVSNAERRLFQLLKHDPDTASWIVLHSLGLSGRAGKPYGEIDFVVLIPGGGVICLEVKGGRVCCKEGVWYTMNRYGHQEQLKRSPFMQAREGMFALRKAIKNGSGSDNDMSRCLFGYAVVFPDVPAPPRTIEFEPWEAIDLHSLHRPISCVILDIIKGQRAKLGRSVDRILPTIGMVKRIQQFLRPDFELVVAASTTIRHSEEKLLRLTEEQFSVLDTLDENPRCLLEGAAGTGKTILALEYAKRSARAGRKTLLLCFNKLLGEWLSGQVRTLCLANLQSGSYYRFLRELILSTSVADEFLQCEREYISKRLFPEAYPFYAEIAIEEKGIHFDALVVDEAQDLLSREVLDILDRCLEGGLAGGIWAIFGDFTRQAIFDAVGSGVDKALIDEYCLQYARARLTRNCRNTRQIGEETVLISGFASPPYRLGDVDGLPVDYRYWRDIEHEESILMKVLSKLLHDGMKPEDIMILSPVRFDHSVASCLSRKGLFDIYDIGSGPASRTTQPRIAYSTIQAFKGMESPVIIICDVNYIDDEEPQSLLYVGMSRARGLLIMLLHESTIDSVGRAVAKKLIEGYTNC